MQSWASTDFTIQQLFRKMKKKDLVNLEQSEGVFKIILQSFHNSIRQLLNCIKRKYIFIINWI